MNEVILVGVGLLTAHLIADFILQTNDTIRNKRKDGWKSTGLLLHTAIAGLLALLLTWKWESWLLIGGLTFVSHWIIDFAKNRYDHKKSFIAFILDQLAHILVIVFILLYLYPQLIILFLMDPDILTDTAIVFLGVILIYRPSGFFIERAIQRWNSASPDDTDSLPEAGKWIGYLERLLIFLFMMINQYSAIGFLIAAKSILRFRDQPGQQRVTEYILLGSLLSFTIAILISMFIKFLLNVY